MPYAHRLRREHRRRGSMPAHAGLMTTGLRTGYGFQLLLEASLARRLGA